MWPTRNFNELREFCNSISNNTISDEEYKKYVDWCEAHNRHIIKRGQKPRRMVERWRIEDDLLWEAKLEIKRKKEEALKNKYKF